MGTIADKLNRLLATKADIRAALIEKRQAVADMDTFASYAEKIRAIQTGLDTSDATAAAGDILSGKTAYGPSGKLTGTIAGKGAGDLTASGAAVSVPAGYYPSAVSKSVAAAAQATPGISVSSSGLITASATQEAGYVAAGTKSATKQLTTQAAATITPGTSAKTAVAAGRYTTGAVTVAGDANLAAGNIRSGVSIFGVAGSAIVPDKVIVTVKNNTSYRFSVGAYPPSGPMYGYLLSHQIDPGVTAQVETAKYSFILVQKSSIGYFIFPWTGNNQPPISAIDGTSTTYGSAFYSITEDVALSLG